MQLQHICLGALALLIHSTASSALPGGAHQGPYELPVIDLGYVKQRASAYNATGKYYNFTNVAFAQPPTGNLRFAAPKSPKHISGIQDGNDKGQTKCAQAWPTWLSELALNQTTVPIDPGETEDCLYLDILVPEKIFKRRFDPRHLAPVMVWIYGGGFVIGSKTQNGDGGGLIVRSLEDPNAEGVIFVAPNYRVGAFGWLGGSDFQRQGGASNAGLLDQRLALEWVQHNIAKFGGDPTRVTAVGESGGASSIGHHLTAGKGKPPFNQAIYQSPDEGSLKFPGDEVFNARFHSFLTRLGVSNLQQARALPYRQVYDGNRATVAAYPGGMFTTFGYSIDGSYVLGNIHQGLEAGRYEQDMAIMTSHNANEGLLFTVTLDPPPTSPSFSFSTYLRAVLPSASDDTIHYIANNLYPLPKFSGSEYVRTNTFNAEAFINSNMYGLQEAYQGQGFAYRFSVPPAIHIQDIGYTLYNGRNNPTGTINTTIAMDMQRYFTQFAMTGNPNRNGLKQMPRSGQNAQLLQFNVTGYDYVSEPDVKTRSEF